MFWKLDDRLCAALALVLPARLLPAPVGVTGSVSDSQKLSTCGTEAVQRQYIWVTGQKTCHTRQVAFSATPLPQCKKHVGFGSCATMQPPLCLVLLVVAWCCSCQTPHASCSKDDQLAGAK